MAMNLNIGGGEDEFFRYKMPKLQAKVEGRGNGIKTKVVNCASIGKALKRPPGYVCKFFGCELGAITQISDDKDEYIVNGSHSEKDLIRVLEKFIDMFVLCKKCKLPETELKVSQKRRTIKEVCAACGNSDMVDLTHRLCNHIFQNPPPKIKKSSRREEAAAAQENLAADAEKANSKKKKEKKVKDPEEKSEKKKSKTSAKDPSRDGDEAGADGDGLVERTSELSLEDKSDKSDKKLNAMGNSFEDEDRKEDEEEDDDEEDQPKDPVAAMINEGMGPKKIAKQVKAMTTEPDARAKMLITGFLREDYIDVLDKVAESMVTALKNAGITESTGDTICRTFDAVAVDQPEVVSKFTNIMKLLYDEDLVDEDQIRNWYARPHVLSVKEAVKPLIIWLENAEEESDEE
mmetsp:Transcript_11556/g.35326  ORF Transcript_11556/g.35326 Transcript_11556/m.35326 type:complete len:404 (-) Transcript_11556:78-1289(-)